MFPNFYPFLASKWVQHGSKIASKWLPGGSWPWGEPLGANADFGVILGAQMVIFGPSRDAFGSNQQQTAAKIGK